MEQSDKGMKNWYWLYWAAMSAADANHKSARPTLVMAGLSLVP
jgi:hypothetical protein